jgi:predicted dehydrogenase
MAKRTAPIRCGIIGFGFIGPHHAEAIGRLGNAEVVAVASRDVDKARAKAQRFGVEKVCGSFEELIAGPEIDVVDIATPTASHYPIAMAAIRRGKHVIVDKPLALNVAQAGDMVRAAKAAGIVNAVTFNYRYSPLVQQARVMVQRGDIGKLHLVHGHYLQEWLLQPTDFSWRLEPEESGQAAMIADAGSHWFDLVEHVTGLEITSVLAELHTVMKVRHKPAGAREAFSEQRDDSTEPYEVQVPDLGAAMLRFSNGAAGIFLTSSLCAGHKNDLRLELHGAKASIAWLQEEPNRLWIGKRGEPDQVLTKDPLLLDPSIRHYAALPGGHNEAWPDAFKNTMANIFDFIASGRHPREADGVSFATFENGLRTTRIADCLVRSGKAGGVWTEISNMTSIE